MAQAWWFLMRARLIKVAVISQSHKGRTESSIPAIVATFCARVAFRQAYRPLCPPFPRRKARRHAPCEERQDPTLLSGNFK